MKKRLCKNEKALLMARALALFSVLFLVADFLVAQERVQKGDSPKKSSLALRLILSQPKNCLGKNSIKMNIEMINIGDKSISIDKTALWKSFDIAYFNGEIPDGLWLKRYGFNEKYGDYVLLSPNQKYNESYEFSFMKEENVKDDFFERAGRYEVEMKYQIQNFDKNSAKIAETIFTDEVISNKVSFYLKKCRHKKH